MLEGGDSSSPILFRPNPAFWKWQWLFISFPKLLRVPIFLFHFFPSYFIVSCPPWWMLFLHSSPGHYRHTHLCVCVCKVAISPSQELQCLLVDSCPCWGCWLAGASMLHWACVFPAHPPKCLGLRVLRSAPQGSLGCCGSLPRTIFQGLSGAG